MSLRSAAGARCGALRSCLSGWASPGIGRATIRTYSGGMRQRAMIALALACSPDLIVADEPTTALDVMIQAQILELLAGLSSELGMATIMVTHDLGVVGQRCDRVLVMYGGTIAEEAEAGACTPSRGTPTRRHCSPRSRTWPTRRGRSSRSPARPRGWTPCRRAARSRRAARWSSTGAWLSVRPPTS